MAAQHQKPHFPRHLLDWTGNELAAYATGRAGCFSTRICMHALVVRCGQVVGKVLPAQQTDVTSGFKSGDFHDNEGLEVGIHGQMLFPFRSQMPTAPNTTITRMGNS